MKYYKVKAEFDNYPKDKNKTDIYIKNELYTETEIKKQKLNKRYMIEVNISPKKTYWSFGCRYAL